MEDVEDDGGYSDDSGEDSDYMDGGGGHSIEDDKYISDSEASDDGDKKRKKPVKGVQKNGAPSKKRTKIDAAPHNNVGTYKPEWVSKKTFKSTVPRSSPTRSYVSPGPKTFMSMTSDLERKRAQLNNKSPSSEGRLTSIRPQPTVMNFFSKLDQFKYKGGNSNVNTRASIPISAPSSLSSPEKESPKKIPFARDTLLSPSKFVLYDSEKEEEPQTMTNIKRKRNKALVMSDDESETPKPTKTLPSPSPSSSTSTTNKPPSSSSSTANKENIKTASANTTTPTPPSLPPAPSSLTPSSSSSKINGKPPAPTKPTPAQSKPTTTETPKDNKIDKKKEMIEVNEKATNGKTVKQDDDVVVISSAGTPHESDEDVVFTGTSNSRASISIPEEEEEEEEEEMAFGIHTIIQSCEKFSRKMVQVLSGWDKNSVQKEGNGMIKVPTILHCPLRSYQLIGLNWLALLYDQRMCGILADEMGLGKTVQTISLLAHLLERKNNSGPHIVVVPSTTLSNWAREFEKWCPTITVFTYYGEYNVVLTTYNMAYGKIDRPFLKKYNWQYMILDEAHNIKNSESSRYQHLLKLKSEFRLLLTGTPLQNNLTELWALLNFLMPTISTEIGRPKEADSVFQQLLDSDSGQGELLSRMKKILSPFILRRLKSEVSHEIKPKIEVIEICTLPAIQKQMYDDVRSSSKKLWNQRNAESAQNAKAAKKKGRKKKTEDMDDIIELDDDKSPQAPSSAGLINNILMQFRKMANHPLLCRAFYTQDQILTIRDILKQSDPDYIDENPEYILEDLEVASDYELHSLCENNPLLSGLKLTNEQLYESSGKMVKLKQLLAELKANGNRILLFSQMTRILDILELFLEHEGYAFVRLDGSTPVNTRQDIIDNYNTDHTIFIFLLSTKAGGMGINLTSAETVIFYDISFNPQVDKQAEDRCHRLGQEKQVKVIKLIAEETVDQYMLQLSEQKKELHDSMLEEGAFEKEKGSKMEAKKLLKMFDALFKNLPQE